MELKIRRWFTQVEHKLEESGFADGTPLRKVAAICVVENPLAHQGRVEDLSGLILASPQLGAFLAKIAMDAMGPHAVESYGKGGVVGVGGEQEHIAALVTSAFAEPIRQAIGGGKAWISSFTKRGGIGTEIDIPLAHKDALYVRSHYDGVSVKLHDGPDADEIAVIVCLASRGRIGARVGGLAAADISGSDGLH